MTAVDTQIALSDIYETKYGIYNHIGASIRRPLSSVAFHQCEDINTGSMLEHFHRLYIEKRIRENFGLTIDEYLDRPMDVIEVMNKVADEENNRHRASAENIEEQFKNLQNQAR